MPNRFKGITELKSNQDYEKLVSEGSITDKDGVQHTYDQLGELYITDDAVEEELRSSIADLQNRVDDLETSIGEGSTDLTDINNSITQINEDITEINTSISDLSSDKLDKNQTTDNTGKLLNVSLDGNITTLDSGTAGQILQSNGEGIAPTWVNLSENNLIRLTGTETDPIDILTDIEAGNLYLCSGYIHLSKQSTTAIDLGTNYILIYMQNDAPAGGFTLIRILDTIFEDHSQYIQVLILPLEF